MRRRLDTGPQGHGHTGRRRSDCMTVGRSSGAGRPAGGRDRPPASVVARKRSLADRWSVSPFGRVSHGWDPAAARSSGQRGRRELGDRGGPIIGGRLAEEPIPADSRGIAWFPAPLPARPRPRFHAPPATHPGARRGGARAHADHPAAVRRPGEWGRRPGASGSLRSARIRAADAHPVPVHSKNGTPRSRWLSGRAASGVPQEPVPSRYWKVRWHSFPRQTTSPMSRVPWCRSSSVPRRQRVSRRRLGRSRAISAS